MTSQPICATLLHVNGRCHLLRGVFLWALVLASRLVAADYPMGHRIVTNVDAARAGRAIEVELHYPAVSNGHDVAVAEAPAGGFPVVVFAHGRQMPLIAYSNFWALLPPRGYVVACPNTVTGVFSSMQVPYMQGVFAYDLMHTAQWVQDQNTNSGGPLYGAIAPRTAVLGHSFGGGAAAYAATSGVIDAAAIFASYVAHTDLLGAVGAPFAVFGGSEDHDTPVVPTQQMYYAMVMASNKTLLSIDGGTHCRFADYVYECDESVEGGTTNGLDRVEQQAITVQFLHPWLDWVLKDSDSGQAEWEVLLINSDRVSVLHEYPAQEEPRLIIEPGAPGMGEVELRWLSATHRVYQCQASTNLTGTAWHDEAAPVTGNAGRTWMPLSTSNGNTACFFRLGVQTNVP